jgi:hypothetical protein
MAQQPMSGLGLLSWSSVTAVFYGVGLLAPRPTPNLEDQVSLFMTPGDSVAQLYPWALGSSGTSGVPLPVLTTVGPTEPNLSEKLTIAQLVKKMPGSHGTEVSLPCSQEPANGPYSEPR